MNFSEFLQSGTQIVVAALYVIGIFLKSLHKFPDNLIPFALTAIGVAVCGWNSGLSAGSVIQGILAAGAAVLINQCYKQSEKAQDTL